MTDRQSRNSWGVAERWQQFWFDEIPPHSYALLRVAVGLVGCLSLLQLHDVRVFWDASGMIPADDNGLGLKPWLVANGLGDIGGRVLFVACVTSFVAMIIGFWSGVAVAASLAASLVQILWNALPLSGAHPAIQGLLFCLIWADCGAVWSVDAWLARRRSVSGNSSVEPYPIAPLRLVRFQVALVYFSTGLWKLQSAHWRDGATIHYVLDSNVFRRIPHDLPRALDPVATILTYSTFFWELGFALMLLNRHTRKVALFIGVALHLGMALVMEIGPFHWVMLASYLSFLNPHWVARRFTQLPDVFVRLHFGNPRREFQV